MSLSKDWRRLNRDLLQVTKAIVVELLKREHDEPFIATAAAFMHKASATLGAVNTLYASNLSEPAQVLVRVQLELRITFDCFLSMCHDDLEGTLRRVASAMMLEKVKQARASGFLGLSADEIARLEQAEREIEAHFGAQVFAAIRKHGFTGVPLEQRATIGGHEAAYQVVYRNFSRNVHSTDFMESYLAMGLYKDQLDPRYIEERDIVSLYTSHFSAGGMAEFANAVYKLGFNKELDDLGKRQAELKKRKERET